MRAPATAKVEPLNNSVEAAIVEQEQEIEGISLRSASSLESIQPPPAKSRGRPRKPKETKETKETKRPVQSAVKKPKRQSARSQPSDSDSESSSDSDRRSDSSSDSETPATPATPKRKGGRPKRSRSPPVSPRRFSPGRPPRVVHPFLGGQRLAALAKETFMNNAAAQAIVVEKAVFEVGKAHRKRVAWTPVEIESLQNGVRIHGESAWSAIFYDTNLHFHPNRTQVDLKDKWRNLTAYVAYNEHPIRRFVLVDTRHNEILSPAGNPHVLNNRWPRDAALKLSTKDWVYPVDERGIRADSALIHLKEVMDATGRCWRPQVVHVYRATRVLQRPRNIAKFKHYNAVWTGKVDKIAEELLIRADEIMPDATNGAEGAEGAAEEASNM